MQLFINIQLMKCSFVLCLFFVLLLFFLPHMPRASWHYYFLNGWQFIKLPLISNQLSFSFHSIIIIFYKLTNVWSLYSLYSTRTRTYFAYYERNESSDIYWILSQFHSLSQSIHSLITILIYWNFPNKCKAMHADAIANFWDLYIEII